MSSVAEVLDDLDAAVAALGGVDWCGVGGETTEENLKGSCGPATKSR